MSEVREIMRERFDFLFAQGVGDVGHDSLAAADTRAGFVVVQRLQQIILALGGDAAKVPVPRLRTAYTHLKAYEKQRG